MLQAEQFCTTFLASCGRWKINAQLDPCYTWLQDVYMGSFRDVVSGGTAFSYDTTYFMEWSLRASDNQQITFHLEVSQPMSFAIENSFNVHSSKIDRVVGSYTGGKAKFEIRKDILCNPEDITIKVGGILKKTMSDKSGKLTFNVTAQKSNWSLNITPRSYIQPLTSSHPLSNTTTQLGASGSTVAPVVGHSSGFPPVSLSFNPAVPPPQNRFTETDAAVGFRDVTTGYSNITSPPKNQFSEADAAVGFRNITTGYGNTTSLPKRKIIPGDQSSTSSSSRISIGEKSKKKFTPMARTSTPRKHKKGTGELHHYDTISPPRSPPVLDLSSSDEISPDQIDLFTRQFQEALNVDSNDPLSQFLTSSLTSVLTHITARKARLNDTSLDEEMRRHAEQMNNLYDLTKYRILSRSQPTPKQPAQPVAGAACEAPAIGSNSTPQLVDGHGSTPTSPQRGAVANNSLNQQQQLAVSLNHTASENQNIPDVFNMSISNAPTQENKSVSNSPENKQMVTRSQSQKK